MLEVTPADVVNVARRAAYGYLRSRPSLAWQSDDMLGDAMLAAHVAHQRWNGNGTFGGFAYPRVVGGVIDGLRSRSYLTRRDYATRRSTVPLSLSTEDLVRLDIADPHAEDGNRRVESQMTVCWMLGRLRVREREVIQRVDINGEMQADVGRDMGISASRVCQIRKVALQWLSNNLDVEEVVR